MGAGRVVAEGTLGELLGLCPGLRQRTRGFLSKPLADLGLEHKTSDSQALPSVDLPGAGAVERGQRQRAEEELLSVG